jgi:DNA mismatch endonuclease (patch repair protein)
MVDVLTPAQRSRCMARIRSKNTSPELAVHKLLKQLGLRFSVHLKTLPGTPDIVLPNRKVAIFVHGCFWHIHRCRYGRVVPATNREFWRQKRSGNVRRDKRNTRELRKEGWKVLTVWECWTRKPDPLLEKLSVFLRQAQHSTHSRYKKRGS